MWRCKPEWDEAQRRIKGEAPLNEPRFQLDETLIQKLVSQSRGEISLTPVPKKQMPLINNDIISDAIATWGEEKQYTQLGEECGEYVTEMCHLLFRPDRPNDLAHFLEEVVGVRIAVDHVIALHQEQCEQIYKDQIAKEIAAMKKVWGCAL